MTQPPSGAQTSPRPRISEEDRIARLQLRSPRVGPATYKRLMAAHGSAAEALKALPDLARSKGVKSYQLCSEHIAQREYFSGKKNASDLIFEHDSSYPRLLAEISDAPPFLWGWAIKISSPAPVWPSSARVFQSNPLGFTRPHDFF